MKTKTTKTELTNKELNLLIEGLSKAINVFELEESPNSLPAKLMDKLWEAKELTKSTELSEKEIILLIEGLSKTVSLFELEENPNSLPAKLMDKLFEAKEFTKSKTELKRQALKEKCLKLKSNFDWHWSRMHGCDKSLKRTREIAKEMEELQILLIK